MLTASDELISLIEQIEFILEADNDEDRTELIDNFKTQANNCLVNAEKTFNAIGSDAVDEQIRSVQVAVSVLISTECCNKSYVTAMDSMFWGAEVFNSDLSSWNVSNVTVMSHMFYSASAFNGDLSSWNVSNVTTMQSMFCKTKVNKDTIKKWNLERKDLGKGLFENPYS